MSNSRYCHILSILFDYFLHYFRRQSIQENPKPPVKSEAEKIKDSKKYSIKGKVRRKPSERNIDPFQNVGMKIQRF